MACDRCNTLKSNGVVCLGRGEIKMRKYTGPAIDDIIMKIWGFKAKYVIEAAGDYQFISCCPICGEKLVQVSKLAEKFKSNDPTAP